MTGASSISAQPNVPEPAGDGSNKKLALNPDTRGHTTGITGLWQPSVHSDVAFLTSSNKPFTDICLHVASDVSPTRLENTSDA